MTRTKDNKKAQNRVLADFEFHTPQNKVMGMVCCSYQVITGENKEAPVNVWLHKDREAWRGLAKTLAGYKDTHIFMAYAVTAEARSFLSLG